MHESTNLPLSLHSPKRLQILWIEALVHIVQVMQVASTSSLTTTDDRIHHNASGLESEITETEEDEDDHKGREGADKSKKSRWRNNPHHSDHIDNTNIPKESLISAPGGCSCHCYRAYDAMLYTAHVGDCRAVMLGSAPPRTINVRGSAASSKAQASASPSTGNQGNQTDDESSHHSSDEVRCNTTTMILLHLFEQTNVFHFFTL